MAKQDLYRYLENKKTEAVKKIDDFFFKNYNEVLDSKLCEFGVREEAKRLHDLGGDAELESINKAWKSQKHSVEVEYNKLIAVCKETRSNSELVEYLVSLGFEEPKMRELLDTPISTALSTNINTSLLMLGGNSND